VTCDHDSTHFPTQSEAKAAQAASVSLVQHGGDKAQPKSHFVFVRLFVNKKRESQPTQRRFSDLSLDLCLDSVDGHHSYDDDDYDGAYGCAFNRFGDDEDDDDDTSGCEHGCKDRQWLSRAEMSGGVQDREELYITKVRTFKLVY
jgi:hypothetical protein